MFDNAKYIVSMNKTHDSLNRDHLATLAPVMRIENTDDDLHEYNSDTFEEDPFLHAGPQLYAVSAQVMLTANLWTEAGLVNGSCGTIVHILKPTDNRNRRVIMVDFPEYHGPVLSPLHPTVLPITQVHAGNSKGMPLTLAWAITIHKFQGMTLQHATVDIGEKEFASGLSFVALSCCKTFHSLRIQPFDFPRLQHIEKGQLVKARQHELMHLRELTSATTTRQTC